MSIVANQAGFRFSCPGATLEILTLEGEEALNRLFEFRLRLVQKSAYGVRDALDPLSFLGLSCQLTLAGAQGGRTLFGILQRFTFVSASTDQLEYEAVFVPAWFKLTLNRANRIFQQKSTPEILSELFSSSGMSGRFELQLSGSYPPRDYCVQYQESDWDFANRLMEEEGIFYTFHHTEADVLLLGDTCDAYADSGSVNFKPDAAQHQLYDESLRYFTQGARLLPTTSASRDYRFKSPDVRMEASANGDSSGQGGEIYHYPGEFMDLNLGARLTRTRLEAAQRDRRTFSVIGTTRRLECGALFQLEGHPVQAYNKRWLVTGLRHRAAQSQALEQANVVTSPPPESSSGSQTFGSQTFGSQTVSSVQQQQRLDYRVEAEGLPGDVLFRPTPSTPIPRIGGLQSAVVTGPAGQELYTDAWGRIKLQLQWDREGEFNEHSSCWVRVDQSWAGQGFGKLFHPRIGQEVWVHFLEGDPDRPVIVGRVHNDSQAVPYQLPAKRTLSTMKTQTVGGQGYNEWRFEDQAGKEEIFVHGQKDWRILIEHDKDQRIGLNKNLKVGRHHTIQIGQNKTETIGQNETSQIQKDRSQSVGMNEQRTIGILRDQKIGSDDVLSIGANHRIAVGHDYHLRVSDAQEESIGKRYNLEAEKCIHYASLSDHLGVEAKTSIRFACGGASLELKADGTITVEGTLSIGVKGDSQLNLKGGVLKLN